MSLPGSLSFDGWTGQEAATGSLVTDAEHWGAVRGLPAPQETLAFGAPGSPTDWGHADVGYGVLLLDDPALTPAEKGAGAGLPAAVERILEARPGTVLLRWSEALGDSHVRRYYPDGASQDCLVGLTPFGVARGDFLPRYVLIVGGPEEIPWQVHYSLAVNHAVGRLPFTGVALSPYVDAMLDHWTQATLDPTSPVIWTVDHGPQDITRLMRQAITAKVDKAFTGTLAGLRHLTDAAATGDALLTELGRVANRPALVVTSSHGATPVGDETALAATLGLPVDRSHDLVAVDDLDAAMPPGAVWFAQACCSAGGAGPSSYRGLLSPTSSAGEATEAVASLGPVVSPAALRLLGRAAPVRAVLGHVEPTFDWTLRSQETGQLLGGNIVRGLSTNLHHGQPLGYAFSDYRAGVGQLNTQWARLRDKLAAGDETVLEQMTRTRLTALDRQSLVLLGDPTVALPPLP